MTKMENLASIPVGNALLAAEGKYVFMETFGCQMNEDDSLRMLESLKRENYIKTDNPKDADLILINTCSIRDKAEHKVYSTAGKFRKLKSDNPKVIIGISGCIAQRRGKDLFKKMPYVDMVIGTHNAHKLPALVKEASAGSGKKIVSIEMRNRLERGEYEVFKPSEASGTPVKALLSIMRGCDNFCSYCVVPFVRGREVSRPVNEVIRDAAALAGYGIKEITLIGQNVNRYAGDVSFPELIHRVCKTDGIERVRFMTSHPKDIPVSLIRLFGEEKKLSRHIHLPLQSGSDIILKKMNRGYTVSDYLKMVECFKKLYPEIAVTTDIIVGFPGETEEDFDSTMRVLKEVEFDGVFAFKYSPRPDTAAAGFSGHLSDDVKKKRFETLQSEVKDIVFKKNRLLVGRKMEVMVQDKSKMNPDEITGRTTCNRIVNFPGTLNLRGETVLVTITEAHANSLKGVSETPERTNQC